MAVEFRVISIGTLGANPLWNERTAVRTGHATTVLIASEGRGKAGVSAMILVDPSLPAPALLARMSERTKVKAAEVTIVFLTSLDPERRRALASFEQAAWYAHPVEIESARKRAETAVEEARSEGDGAALDRLGVEREMLAKVKEAPDQLAAGVDLFPLPGVSRGTCGLVLPMPGATVVISGDAVATQEHMGEAKVLPWCEEMEKARESMKEVIEIADVIIPGRDNVMFNPVRRLM